ncbi:CDP-glycerol glycerophosphotransferase family protein [Chromobacterium amazonense]|uniref:CDP-glycerol glycerophosphotransferase family protein n=1 Tax=Chromobacterium amazonense TaxID=1382803 RepID=UPI0031F6417A
MNRKFKKLLRDPKLFFKDMAVKHGRKMGILPPDPETIGHYQYTVVSAVYNVGRYLDDYFNSLVKQKLDFKRHIHLIMVDDGSTDDSAEIIKGWQKKYPDNITYLWKENGGQASARNLGLTHVKTEFVTFTDPDDFLDKNYFSEIDKEIFKRKNKTFSFIASNIILFDEKNKSYSKKHPLAFRFSENKTYITNTEDIRCTQLSAASAIYKTDELKNNNITFPEDVKPTFEDAFFNGLTTLIFKECLIIPRAKYYYRRRSDKSSTVDMAWDDPRKYNSVFSNGYIKLLKLSMDKNGKIPANIQNTVFYDLSFYIKRFVYQNRHFYALSGNLQNDLKANLQEVIQFIDDSIIEKFNIAGFWWFYRYGSLLMKNSIPTKGHAFFIKSIDEKRKLIEISYFSDSNYFTGEFLLDGIESIPVFDKVVQHTLCDDLFLLEKRVWIHYASESQIITANLIGTPQNLAVSHGGVSQKHHSIENIANHYKNVTKNEISKFPKFDPIKYQHYHNCWLLMDRDYKADDNAEHLYRYLKNNHPEINAKFSIRKNSSDYNRLKSEGFDLIDYESDDFYAALRLCKKFISSHNSPALIRKFNQNLVIDKHFIFLQHGVTVSDVSHAFNNTKIDLFITAANDEFKSIVGDHTKYRFSSANVALTGFPRHDALLENNGITSDSIVIMPTWRVYLSGKYTGDGLAREFNNEFSESDYAKNWLAVLRSQELFEYANEHNLKIKFYPHAEITPYLSEMHIPDYVEIITGFNDSIQDVFRSSSIFITDYSSVAFEAALLKRHIIYFQFDSDRFFSEHYPSGYFDYQRDGFGPVLNSASDVVTHIKSLDPNHYHGEFLDRQERFFKFRDQCCSQRVVDEIKKLDEPYNNNEMDLQIAQSNALCATRTGLWPLAERRWRQLLELTSMEEKQNAAIYLAESLLEQGRLHEAHIYFSNIKNETAVNYLRLKARMEMARHDWVAAIDLWQQAQPEQTADRLRYLRCLAELQCLDACETYLQDEWVLDLPAHHQALVDAWRAVAAQDWQAASHSLESALVACSGDELSLFKPELLLARCYRELGQLNLAHLQLVAYEKHTANDPQCREHIALLAQARGQWDKVVNQLQKAYAPLTDMPQPLAPVYVQGLRQLNKGKEAEQAVAQWRDLWPDNLVLRQHAVELMLENQCWEEAMLLLPTRFTSSQDALRLALLPRISTLRSNGKLTQAETLFAQCFGDTDNRIHVWNDAIWRERANLHLARQQWMQVLSCLDGMEEHTPLDFLVRIQSLAELGLATELETLLHTPMALEQEASLRQLALAWHCVARQDWSWAASLLLAEIGNWSTENLRTFQPQLLLAHCLRKQGLLDAAHAQLLAFEKHSANHPQCRVQIALLASVRGQWDKVLAQISRAYPTFADQPEPLLAIYIQALRMQNKIAEAEQALQALLPSHPNNQELQIEAARLATDCGFWSQAIIRWSHLLSITAEAPFKLAEAYRMTGQLEQAFLTLTSPSCRIPANVEEWKLKAEIAQLTNQWDQAAECWVALIQYYPDQANQENWERLNSVQVIKALKDNNMPLMT